VRLKIDLRGTSDGYFRFSFVGRHHGCTTRSRCSLKSHNIERVSRGEIWANCIETEYLLEAARNAPSCDGIDSDKVSMLSKREVQVAEGAAQGYSNKQIADQFRLSEHTVKNYLSRVFEKLEVSNRFELLFLLFNEGNGLSTERWDQMCLGWAIR